MQLKTHRPEAPDRYETKLEASMTSISAIDWLGITSAPLLALELFAFCALALTALMCSPYDTRALPHPGNSVQAARVTLDEHLTKGEITREEYVERRKALDFTAAII
jgi:hypothetical protein